MILSGCTKPVTNRPNFGSLSTIEWPPAIEIPALLQTLAAPFKTAPSRSTPNTSTGQPTKLRALIGFAPIA